MTHPVLTRLTAFSVPLLLSACASTADRGAATTPPQGHDLVLATLFCNTAAEFTATTYSLYQGADARLDRLLADRSRTAALEQSDGFQELPPAIILDVDETVLDNSPYQVRQILDGTGYPTGWADWCNEAQADPIPGALEFTSRAASMGITVFYVTNRKAPVEAGTRRNLVKLGFPMRDDIDTLLMRGEREDWTSDKTSRRAHVAKDFRILMLFGDNLGDFVSLEEAQGWPAERRFAMAAHGEKWGREWIMLPNPMYGYWDGAVLQTAKDPSLADAHRLRVEAMHARR